MKRLVLVLLALTMSPFAFASMGNEGGHGGDPYALEFTTLARLLRNEMTKATPTPVLEKWNVSAATFDTAIKTTWVVSAEGSEVKLEGVEVDAINSDQTHQGLIHTIKINRTRWREADLIQKLRLVLHEYFGVMNVERDTYTASLDFVSLIKAAAAKAPAADLMTNLFYGRVVNIAPPTEAETCSVAIQTQALAEANRQAVSKCVLSGEKKCAVVQSSSEAILSEQIMGLRYCETLVIVR